MKKKLLSVIFSLVLALTTMPMMASVSFADEVGTVPVIMVKAQTSGSTAVKLSWNKVSGATKYVIYGQKCGNNFKKLKTISGTSYIVKKIKGKKLEAHKTYKFYVSAYSGSEKLVSSKSIHFITAKTKGKCANASKITAKYSSKTLESGKTLKLGATVKVYQNKKHITTSHGAKLRYVSNNPSVASVNANGVVTAKEEGTAIIYIQDIGGLWCKTTVTVKKRSLTQLGTGEKVGYYAVCIWNIEQQADGSDIVTFGPAVGTTYERAIGNAVELTDSWSDIQQAAANGTAHIKYEEALKRGFIKKIKISGNEIFAPSGTFSAFYSTIPTDYRKWNISYNGASRDEPASDYSSSRIRATLNGINNDWEYIRPSVEYAFPYSKSDCLAAEECLLSCFPAELQEVITPRTFEVPTIWFSADPYEILISESVTDKLWLPSATELYGSSEEAAYVDYGAAFQKNGGPLHTIVVLYREDGREVAGWLRSPYRKNYSDIAINRRSGGGLDHYACTSSVVAIAPFFNIGKN